MSAKNLKVNDRVRRVSGHGCNGYIKEIRQEATVAHDTRDKESLLIIGVQWDNGTHSFFGVNGLEVVKD